MSLKQKQLSYWKSYILIAEIALLVYFSLNIISQDGISGMNFTTSIILVSAVFNTFFLVIFSIYDKGSYKRLNKMGKLLAITNFIFTSLVFSNVLNVTTNWIPALISTLFVAGLALQFYIGLGSLSRIKRSWLFKLNSFLIILITFYGIFLFILRIETGFYYTLFYYGVASLFLISLVSNLINIDLKKEIIPEKLV